MDIRKLNERADMLQLCDELNIPYKKRGATYYVHCPLPEHNDVHATNCFFKEGDSYMYCAVCQRAINAVDLIMYTENMEFLPAAKRLAEIEGVKWETEKKNISDAYEITPADARRIGLRLEKRILHPYRQALWQESPGSYKGFARDTQFDNCYLISKYEYAENALYGTPLADMVLFASREKRNSLIKRIQMMDSAGLDSSDVRLRLKEVVRIGKTAASFASYEARNNKSGN